jgi:hypothetical protein
MVVVGYCGAGGLRVIAFVVILEIRNVRMQVRRGDQRVGVLERVIGIRRIEGWLQARDWSALVRRTKWGRLDASCSVGWRELISGKQRRAGYCGCERRRGRIDVKCRGASNGRNKEGDCTVISGRVGRCRSSARDIRWSLFRDTLKSRIDILRGLPQGRREEQRTERGIGRLLGV